MPITITIVPEGDTLDTEITRLTTDVRRALEARPEVDEVRPPTMPGPEGSKVGEAIALGALLVAVAPVALAGIINLVRDYLNRPAAPATKVKVKVGDSDIEIEFDPREITPDQLGDLVARLRDAGGD